MRKIHVQQGIAELAECIVEPLGRARIEHGNRLQHARQVRIAGLDTSHAERTGQRRIAPRERLVMRPQGAQFTLVIPQQLVHDRPLHARFPLHYWRSGSC